MSDRTKRIAVGSLMYAVAEAVAAGADWPTVLDAVTAAYHPKSFEIGGTLVVWSFPVPNEKQAA